MSTVSSSTPARRRASLVAATPRSTAGTSANAPRNFPIGVRAPSTMTARSIDPVGPYGRSSFRVHAVWVQFLTDESELFVGRGVRLPHVIGGADLPSGLLLDALERLSGVDGRQEQLAGVGIRSIDRQLRD